METIENLKQILQQNLSVYRYQHSIHTMEEALQLAKRYHYKEEIAAKTALMHDVAKELSEEEITTWLQHHQNFKTIPAKVLHGYIGAEIVKDYQFTKEMQEAIKYHSTGRKKMTTLDKIVFLADKIEKGKTYPGIEQERQMAKIDLDKAVILCMQNQIKHLQQEKKEIDPKVFQALEDLQPKINVT